MFFPAVSAAKALICSVFFGTGEPVPFQEEWLFGGLRFTAGVLLRGHKGDAIKTPPRRGC